MTSANIKLSKSETDEVIEFQIPEGSLNFLKKIISEEIINGIEISEEQLELLHRTPALFEKNILKFREITASEQEGVGTTKQILYFSPLAIALFLQKPLDSNETENYLTVFLQNSKLFDYQVMSNSKYARELFPEFYSTIFEKYLLPSSPFGAERLPEEFHNSELRNAIMTEVQNWQISCRDNSPIQSSQQHKELITV